ncbi:MAG: MBL fold metallo-hydrolase [Microbacterium ginsengisoli]|jgi:glyoxylase-like metal-dependent hydrolase (beta-lactamase superfamily II)|uniref:MBL fold metallo-hydrolase n=1 Tax=Microbacterium TaxID=33882 RepID=UPI0006F6FED2|nr:MULTISPECIES: MBL fold metallo-hydrolase [Microbacterium]MBN9197207.1 MBL fold metallo-hydrolase [Microbacterium ginsengisoli]KQR91134.1 hypothetical protein ASF93_07185 [Microbacterium sp. Leaf347]KQS01146.1 hypothetical protein ASG00_10015 [Microbacterium sp. Leaf351]KXC07209.1 hypothetical protein MhomT_01290 [Microbacterium hominis]MBN9208657.1 MBL fold metallo-hydrolase [Microbacterium ginsengisoli]
MTLDGTNTWVIDVGAGVLIVDPGPADRAHLDEAIGASVVASVLLTHRHPDHSAALDMLPSGTPVHAADPALARSSAPLRRGAMLAFSPVRIEVLSTPGHTDDSVCFRVDSEGASCVITGDTLLGGRHATFVSRRSGDLDALLSSLATISSLRGLPGLPGHGDFIPDVGAHASAALAHHHRRLTRLEKLLRAHPDLDLEYHLRSRYPNDPGRRRAAAWMAHVEADYLRSTGRLSRPVGPLDPP